MINVREATEDDAEVLAELNNAFNGVRRSTVEILARDACWSASGGGSSR